MLGIGLYRLRQLLQRAPFAALGPLFGMAAAHMSIELARGRFVSVAISLLVIPVVALTVSHVAQRDSAGPVGLLCFILGSVSAVGASMLLTLGLTAGSGTVFVIGLRHLVVGAYAWAAIASEPPPRRVQRLAPVRL
jgi:hypothetical protein